MDYDFQTLIVKVQDGIATVVMNRPEKRNAVDAQMFEELEQAFTAIGADADVRAFVLTGAGDHFCSGADLSAFASEGIRTPGQMLVRMRQIHAVMERIVYCPKPGIAAVRGWAAGGGANLALACDLVIMSEDAKFAELFVKRGLVVDMSGTFTLVRAIGLHRAKELALLGDPIDASRCAEIGIANVVVPVGEFESKVNEWSRKLADGPPIALSLVKRALNDSFSRSFDDVLQDESLNQSITLSSGDAAEALSAFLNKREPKFTGA